MKFAMQTAEALMAEAKKFSKNGNGRRSQLLQTGSEAPR
jgi:hypothetical protein